MHCKLRRVATVNPQNRAHFCESAHSSAAMPDIAGNGTSFMPSCRHTGRRHGIARHAIAPPLRASRPAADEPCRARHAGACLARHLTSRAISHIRYAQDTLAAYDGTVPFQRRPTHYVHAPSARQLAFRVCQLARPWFAYATAHGHAVAGCGRVFTDAWGFWRGL